MDKELERNKDSYFKFLESIKEQINPKLPAINR